MLRLKTKFGALKSAAETTAAWCCEERIAERIWKRDFTLWKAQDTEIANRLGWLESPDTTGSSLPEVDEMVSAVRRDGYDRVLLVGMGGSSLAPELFASTFRASPGFCRLDVLDSTHPDAIKRKLDELDLATSLIVVSTKSGSTVETLSFLKFFFTQFSEHGTAGPPGEHFVAITDPGSDLQQLASSLGFRHTFLNDPGIGGRYSALSLFGLVPARLLGVDVEKILASSRVAVSSFRDSTEDPGLQLGVLLSAGSMQGRDKLTLVASPSLSSFGAWVEQLIAESTGKEGKGILPVNGEQLGSPQDYSDDRLFLHLRFRGENEKDEQINALALAGHPVVELELENLYDLGAAFFTCEIATAVAGARLQINPFDQPDVEAAKQIAREMVATYLEAGELPQMEPTFDDGGQQVFGGTPGTEPAAALVDFLQKRTEIIAPYISVHAYLDPSAQTARQLEELQLHLRASTRMAVTTGYGPRFLHSTGQLHKGDGGNGLFLQLTGDWSARLGIPDEPGISRSCIDFGTLIEAQSMGDRQALLDAGRSVIRIHLGENVPHALRELLASLRRIT